MGANVINRANDPWRVGSIINSTTGRMNRAYTTFRGLTSGFTIRGILFVFIIVSMLVGALSYIIYNSIDGFQSGNSNQRPRKISRKSRISGKK